MPSIKVTRSLESKDTFVKNNIKPTASKQKKDLLKAPHTHCYYLTSNIIVGAQPIPDTLDAIINTPVTIIVNLEDDPETGWYRTKLPKEIEYHNLPTKSGRPPNKEKAEQLASYVLEHLKKEGTKAYIHCVGGYGRSATFAGMLIGIKYNLDVSEIVEHLEKRRRTREDQTKSYIPTPETQSQIDFLFNIFGLEEGNVLPDRTDVSWLKKVKASRRK